MLVPVHSDSSGKVVIVIVVVVVSLLVSLASYQDTMLKAFVVVAFMIVIAMSMFHLITLIAAEIQATISTQFCAPSRQLELIEQQRR